MQFVKERKTADLLVLPYWEGKKQAEKASDFSEFDHLAAAPIGTGDFKGKEGESMLLYVEPVKFEKRVLLIGLGTREKISPEVCRKAYGSVIKLAIGKKFSTLNVVIPAGKEFASGVCFKGLCEGLLLANYAFDRMKKEAASLLTKVALLGADQKTLAEGKKLAQIAAAVYFTRDLVNNNADDVTPQVLAQCARDIEKEFPKVKTTVFGKKEIEKFKMGLLLAVSRGAAHDPAFMILEYKGDPASKKKTAIVGKGITYDTGGLNLKPTGSMETMKCDMAGAAVVLGTLRAAASIGLKANLVGVIASTENAIGPNAFKPGDVYRSYLGKSVEISNTDAEGRLILADALAYTEEHLKPTRIIDLATLTGSVVVALGEGLAGLFSNNDALAAALVAAGERTYERVWRMPLCAEYKDELKSKIADLKNAGSRKGGSISAALFLQEFIKESAAPTPWAHLDIAGTAFLSEIKASYHPTYATGMGVRLLIDLLENDGK